MGSGPMAVVGGMDQTPAVDAVMAAIERIT
jgi:hypothetical protein